MVKSLVFSALGRILFQDKKEYDCIKYEQLETYIENILERHRNISHILVGTPSIVKNGIIKHSDIPELENMHLSVTLKKRFGLTVLVETDMHYMAYGYCKKTNTENSIITLAYFPSHFPPGTVTIYKEKIIQGANNIAGMIGFLPTNMSCEEQLEMFESKKCVPFIAKSICAIIALINPDTIVMTGDLVDEETLKSIKDICATNIPLEYLPQFLIVDNFDEYYYEGIYQLAVERKDL